MSGPGLQELWFLAPALALLAGILALAPLGAQVLRRGVVFIDLAVAQAAAAAALWASGLGLAHDHGQGGQMLAAALGALLCAALVAQLARRWPQQREALIGLVYVAGASLAMLGARLDPHGREQWLQLLAADVLWAGWPQVGLLALCASLVLLLRWRWPALLGRDAFFYPLFAVVTSWVVPVLGLFLVFVTLIAPALWMQAAWSLWRAASAAAAVAVLGLWASWQFDGPSGACVALALALWGGLSALGGLQRRQPVAAQAAAAVQAAPPAGVEVGQHETHQAQG
ncbi:zinc/manganese transport system permease protein [Paucibacter oligotrophus]|uniref:Zinc/manganese transport system permease protein n=1 Tax=Roseateles oligotrophus TaxID=1769250 RepID=A0A840LAB1_9BURK|nr:metal ABC transporter permease [Roseateles oligotrophus]MBB4843705.1 zinc/manganese transport system permease protein [Roseateles oligotrophus]